MLIVDVVLVKTYFIQVEHFDCHIYLIILLHFTPLHAEMSSSPGVVLSLLIYPCKLRVPTPFWPMVYYNYIKVYVKLFI